MPSFLRFIIICSFILHPVFVEGQQAKFGVNNNDTVGCAPLIGVRFIDSTTGGVTPYTYQWFYIVHLSTGDSVAGSSTSPSPIFTFTRMGLYDIMEIVTGGGAPDTAIKHNFIDIYSSNVNFTTIHISTGDTSLSCPPKVVTFINTTTDTGCGVSFRWSITNINTGSTTYETTTSTTQPLTYNFTVPGYYNISVQESATGCSCGGYATYDSLIKIDSPPIACYTDSLPNLCGPNDTEYFNSGCTVGATSYLWNFGGGGTSTLANPAHVYTATGSYNDTLTVYSSAGCPASVHRHDVTVGNFTPAFSLPLPICNPNFQVEDNTPATNGWSWHDATYTYFGNGPYPIFSFPGAGVYTLIDSVWNTGTGCHGTAVRTFTINPVPVVSFTATPVYRCTPNDTVTFTHSVTDASGISQLIWNFGDASSGHYDTAYSDSVHIYTTTGSFTPILYIKDNNGCATKDSINNYINIDPPVFSIIPQYDSGCTPFIMSYNTSMSPSVGYTINSIRYGDGSAVYVPPIGTISGVHTYTAGGVYTMTATYTLPGSAGGCSYTASKTITVGSIHPVFHPHAVPDTFCPNTKVYFDANCTTCTSIYWNLNNKISTSYNDSDYYNETYTTYFYPPAIVAIADNNGCTDTIDFNIHVLPPVADITTPVVSCDSSNIIHFNSTGSYGATGYHWSFGDGTSSSLSAPTHTYTVPPIGQTYSVVLVDSGGGSYHCFNTASTTVNIFPILDTFYASDTAVCRLTPVYFTGPLPQYGGTYSKYVWTFSSALTPAVTYTVNGNVTSYVFNDTGVYDVQLTVVNANGCDTSLTKHGYIHVTGPIGGISATSAVTGCVSLTVSFHDNNIASAGSTIVSRQWQFSNPPLVAGVADTLIRGYSRDTFYTYPEGNYIVTLIDSDNNHCFSHDTISVHSVKPHAFFTSSSNTSCIEIPVTFTDTNNYCSYQWSFGDGATGTGQVVSHSYSANGTYSVSVSIVTGSGGYLPPGCVDTLRRNNYITIANINVGFALSDSVAICPPLYVTANAASGLGLGYTFYWDIDHQPPYSPGLSFANNFTVPAIYSITLLDSTTSGCKDSISKMVQVFGPAGTVTAIADSGCIPLSVTLYFNDTNGTATIPNFTWITGDDSVYYGVDTPSIAHTYLGAGAFNPYVIISSAGCFVTINAIDTVNAFPPPVVTISHPGIICYGADTILTAGGGSSNDSYAWSPAYGLNTVTDSSVIASPTITTTYSVTVTSLHGCIYNAATTVMVDSVLRLYTGGKDSVCLGQSDTLYAYGIGGNYLWKPDIAISTATSDTVIAYATSSHNYTVIATDNRGCSDTAYFLLTINPLPDITVSPTFPYECQGSSLKIFATGAGPGGTYVWSPNQFIDSITIPDPTVTDTADFVYKVTGTTIYGCVDSDIAVKITVYDSAYTTISNDTIICKGKSAQLLATSTSDISTYLWSPSAGLNNIDIADPVATPDTTTTYSVFIKENPCFTATRDVTVVVVPNPEILLPGGTTIIAGSSIQLIATVGNSSNVSIWAWAPQGTLSCDTCYNPVATPTNSTTYTVTGTTPIGCTSQSSVQINVICVEASQVFVPNTFTPNGDGANDRFYLSGSGLGRINRMSVYNRWGEQVFEAENINANDPGAGWDGTYKGQVLQPDVFIYVFDLLCETGVPFTLKGDISLVR